MLKRQNNINMENSINSLKDYIDIIHENKKNLDSNKHLFYRGHPDKDYKLEPSVFRKQIIMKKIYS